MNCALIAWSIALCETTWFDYKLVGVVHIIEIGAISDLAMNGMWIFYIPAILLLALRGYRYSKE